MGITRDERCSLACGQVLGADAGRGAGKCNYVLSGLHRAGSSQGQELAIAPGPPAPGSRWDIEPKSVNAIKQNSKGKVVFVIPSSQRTNLGSNVGQLVY